MFKALYTDSTYLDPEPDPEPAIRAEFDTFLRYEAVFAVHCIIWCTENRTGISITFVVSHASQQLTQYVLLSILVGWRVMSC